MRGPKMCLVVALVLSLTCVLVVPTPALAYAGPGPGVEMIPFFYSLLVLAGSMLGAVLLWPINALLRRVRRGFRQAVAVPAGRSPSAEA